MYLHILRENYKKKFDCWSFHPCHDMGGFGHWHLLQIVSLSHLCHWHLLQVSHIGWWYVNLKGLEGYVPGAYWETYHTLSSPRTSPPGRRKAPQPVPRTRSPPHNVAAVEKDALELEKWYHGKMSRPESEKLLSTCANGVFLIRESVNRVSLLPTAHTDILLLLCRKWCSAWRVTGA